MTKTSAPVRAPRPQPYTVFGAAIVAGAAAAFGLNSVLDTHLAQARPQVESEAILVALRALPAGAPVTVWDVGLRDWPKAMVPSSAMRVTDDLDDLVVRHPLREGQPILAVQLGRVDATAAEAMARPLAVAPPAAPVNREPERDLWEATPTASVPPASTPPATTTPPAPPVASTVTTVSTSFATRTPPPTPVAAKAVEPTPAVATVVPQPEPVAANEPASPATPTAPVVAPEIAATTPTVEPQPSEDSRPVETISQAPVAMVVAQPAPEAPSEAPTPTHDASVAPPSRLRTAQRSRSAVMPALSVPSRSALSDAIATRADDEASTRTSSRAPTPIVSAERSVTVRDGAGEAPRMLPGGRDMAVAPAAATAQAVRAPQARPTTARATAAGPATRSARAPGFTKGYRPN